MLGYRFSFEAYLKNTSEKATKCSLTTTKILLDTDRRANLSLIFIKAQ